ncbi:MAG: class I SAM-dependent methyltransferase [Clostridia bacterium]|nr:class I SAM-dependent methyltransferase [Clostridia bacterium]
MNDYRALASVYDEFMGDVDFPAYARRYFELLKKHGAAEKTVCDIACGTGNVSLGLVKAGLDLICVDRSPDMLSSLMNNFAAAGVPAPLVLCQDMTELDLYGTVGAFVCTLDGLNHVTDPKKLAEVFRLVSLFTEEPGVLIFDVNTEHKHRVSIGDSNFIYDADDAFAARTTEYDEKTKITRSRLDIFTRRADGLWERGADEVAERAYSLPELEELARPYGLSLVEAFDDLSDRRPDENTDRILAVMRKTI